MCNCRVTLKTATDSLPSMHDLSYLFVLVVHADQLQPKPSDSGEDVKAWSWVGSKDFDHDFTMAQLAVHEAMGHLGSYSKAIVEELTASQEYLKLLVELCHREILLDLKEKGKYQSTVAKEPVDSSNIELPTWAHFCLRDLSKIKHKGVSWLAEFF